MRTFQNVFSRVRSLKVLALVVLVAVSCGGDTEFAYFRVNVSIDPVSVNFDCLNRIYACAADVGGDRDDSGQLRCFKDHIEYKFGAFEYDTKGSGGNVTFTVRMNDSNGKKLASGTSMPVPIVANQMTAATVVVKAVDCVDPLDKAPLAP